MPTALRRGLRTRGCRAGFLVSILVLATGGCTPVPTTAVPTAAAAAESASARDGWGAAVPPAHRVDAPRGARHHARLELVSAAARVTVRAVALPGLLYRISTPPDSGLAPIVRQVPGGVQVALRPTGRDGPDTVDIAVDRRVRWGIRLAAGAGEHHFELGSADLGGLEVAAGAGLVRGRLPHPTGTVPIRLTGGIGHADLQVPATAAIRVSLDRGAALVRTPFSRLAAAPPGTVLDSPAWSRTTDRYLLSVTAGVAGLVVRS